MKIIDVEQGTESWFRARAGLPTASKFSEIFTSQCKPSTSQGRYMNTLLAEWMYGGQVENFTNDWMNRGTELEPDARSYYEMSKNVDVEQVGFVTTDDRSAGGSPDGLLPDGGIEIKCPSPGVHIEYLLKDNIPAKYIPQVQGLMWICERDHWDFVSYYPDMSKQLIVRIDRDDKYIFGLIAELTKFNIKMMEKREQLK